MKQLKAVQHVCIVSEHSEMDLRFIHHMTKKCCSLKIYFEYKNIVLQPDMKINKIKVVQCVCIHFEQLNIIFMFLVHVVD